MINIINKQDCCGCSACVQRCPKQCIQMRADEEGFMYPLVNKTECIDCGLCEDVCPVLNQNEPKLPLNLYAAYNNDKRVRLQSSSGGLFSLIAEEIINKGGVVFGVRLNEDWTPIFDFTETLEGIVAFRGSKYVQAVVGNAYKKAEEFLKLGRDVMFSGTPCQIAALRRFLKKNYDNLLTVDIVCHGVPSPKVWQMYLEDVYCKLIKRNVPGQYKSAIESISFRSKVSGWKKFSFLLGVKLLHHPERDVINFAENFEENCYMRAFLNNINLRPSCYFCPAKQGKSYSDITLADFWGIDKIDSSFDDDKGCSAVIVNTEKGKKFCPFSRIVYKEKTLEAFVKYNAAYNKSSVPQLNRKRFFAQLDKTEDLSQLIFKMDRPTIIQRVMHKVKKLFGINVI